MHRGHRGQHQHRLRDIGRTEGEVDPVEGASDAVLRHHDGEDRQRQRRDEKRRRGVRGDAVSEQKRRGNIGSLLLTVLFVVVAGPVNYFYLRKRKRQMLLFVTVPAVAILFCLLIGLHFLLTQGFDTIVRLEALPTLSRHKYAKCQIRLDLYAPGTQLFHKYMETSNYWC